MHKIKSFALIAMTSLAIMACSGKKEVEQSSVD